jgi:hypothetical protein
MSGGSWKVLFFPLSQAMDKRRRMGARRAKMVGFIGQSYKPSPLLLFTSREGKES